jgi:anti-sigma regulatory factor (Ser/Thr protein kinase)
MPRPSRSREIDDALLRAVERHPTDLVRTVADELELSRAAVAARVRALIETHHLQKSGTTRPHYAVGPHRRGHAVQRLSGLAEDRVWREDIAPLLSGLPRNVIDICHHGVTEMVNNAIDHSEGRTLDIRVERTPERVGLLITDDGIGIFRKITRALDLPDERLALLELSKGKLTTDPRRHSGEGIFFTSRVFDAFQIRSAGLVFDHDATHDVLFEQEQIDATARGTEVAMQIEVSSTRTLKEVFDEFSSGPDDYTFAKTIVPVRLAKIGDENLISRSQAKRLMQRVDRFSKVVLDFEGISSIGQAFADEIFRVFAKEHPAIELITMHAVPGVQQMIRRAEVARDEQASLL